MEVAEDNAQKGIKQLPISVYVLWGGNDVFGNYGYVGCRWIHEKRFNRTEAGRKAASEWPKVQRARVFEQLDFFKEAVGLGRIWDIAFICNPDAEDYGLTSDYNEAMNGCPRRRGHRRWDPHQSDRLNRPIGHDTAGSQVRRRAHDVQQCQPEGCVEVSARGNQHSVVGPADPTRSPGRSGASSPM